MQLLYRSVIGVLAVGGLMPARSAAQDTAAAATITAAEIARDMAALASDSMLTWRGSTRGMEAAARYVADRFARADLESASQLADRFEDAGSFGRQASEWLQRYPRPVDLASLSLVFATGTERAAADFATAAYLPWETAPVRPAKGAVLWVAGRPTIEAVRQAHPEDKIVLFSLAGADTVTSTTEQLLRQIIKESRALVFLHNDSAKFARRLREEAANAVERSQKEHWAVSAWVPAVPGLQHLLAGVGVDLPRLRTDTVSVVRELPALHLSLEWQHPADAGEDADTATTAPNVIGFVEGSDSILKKEYVIISADLAPARPDGAAAQAEARVAGTAGLVALARAFSQPAARPRRSVIFLATSGPAPGFWGSRAFLSSLVEWGLFGGVQLATRPVANLRLDAIGGSLQDSVLINGLEFVELPTQPNWIADGHPELKLAVADGGSVLRPESADAVFTRGTLAVPTLSFHAAARQDGHQAGSPSATVNAEYVARLTRFVFYLAEEIANANHPPKWNAAGRKALMEDQ